MKIQDDILIGYYMMGMELAADDQEFPKWFQYAEEKYACLLGYNDFTIGITDKSEEEILKELKKI